MKKYTFTLLLFLCLLTITGGTFAAYTYYEGKVVEQKENFTPTIEIQTEQSAWGEIKITNRGFKIKIEPEQDKVNYIAKIVFEGSVEAEFTPTAAGTDLDQFKGWEATVEIKNKQHDMKNIFKDLGNDKITQENHKKFTISKIDELKLNEFNLNSKEKAEKFSKDLADTQITITFKEKN